MISALYRYPKGERRAVAQAWARLSNDMQSASRIARGPDADTLRRRALYDARGQTVRSGCTFFGDGRIVPWSIRRSIAGRSDQFDVIVSGAVWKTGGRRRLCRWL